jgi:hypothetical protein
MAKGPAWQLDLPTMSQRKRDQWHRFGDLVYGAGKGAFETSWA